MMADRTSSEAAGGPARHVPVLLPEMLHHLAVVEGGRYIDGAFGAGGYSRAILEMGGSVLAIDRDRAAVEAGASLVAASGGRLTLVEGRFSDLEDFARAAGFVPADGVVLDVGVSSMQVDDAARGFSFRLDGPLDMRMGQAGPDAAAIVNRATAKELAAIIRVFGEERQAGRVARAIVQERGRAPIERTAQLAAIVARAVGPVGAQGRTGRIHPATRTFQALRIFINRELEELALALAAAEAVLSEGGRLVVVAFHSLEDRIVKRFLQERSQAARGSRHAPPAASAPPTFTLLTRRAVEPGKAEVESNRRARSARLRAAVRTGAAARAIDLRAVGVPQLVGVPGPEAFQ
jgi:16S rRNA (cytosine1402-N4)-methyltransferase